MKKVFNFVTKRKNGQAKQGQDGTIPEGSSVGQSSMASSPSTTLRRQTEQSTDDVLLNDFHMSSTKYVIETKSAKDKSLSKLHVSVIKEDLDKVKKQVRADLLELESNNDGSKKLPFSGKKDRELMVNSRDRFNRTPLHLCASVGNVEILWQLLSHGADVHVKDSQGATPLHRAVDSGHNEVARMILDRGCSLDVADIDGDTVLHLASRRSNNEILAALLRKGANPDIKNAKSEAPLHETIRLGQIAASQLLLRSGASVNIPGPEEKTPLILASSKPGMESLVDTLLNYEGDPNHKDRKGRTALEYAKIGGFLETIRLLEEFISDSQHRMNFDDPDYHSFDEDEDQNWTQNDQNAFQRATTYENYPDDDHSIPNDKVEEAKPENDHGVRVSDLSSWESSDPSDGPANKTSNFVSGVKKSTGVMDLSKFLSTSEPDDEDDIIEPLKNKDISKNDAQNERIYDSVENLVDKSSHADDKSILPKSDGKTIIAENRKVEIVEDEDWSVSSRDNSDWDTPRLPGDEPRSSTANLESSTHTKPKNMPLLSTNGNVDLEKTLTFKEELQLKLKLRQGTASTLNQARKTSEDEKSTSEIDVEKLSTFGAPQTSDIVRTSNPGVPFSMNNSPVDSSFSTLMKNSFLSHYEKDSSPIDTAIQSRKSSILSESNQKVNQSFDDETDFLAKTSPLKKCTSDIAIQKSRKEYHHDSSSSSQQNLNYFNAGGNVRSKSVESESKSLPTNETISDGFRQQFKRRSSRSTRSLRSTHFSAIEKSLGSSHQTHKISASSASTSSKGPSRRGSSPKVSSSSIFDSDASSPLLSSPRRFQSSPKSASVLDIKREFITKLKDRELGSKSYTPKKEPPIMERIHSSKPTRQISSSGISLADSEMTDYCNPDLLAQIQNLQYLLDKEREDRKKAEEILETSSKDGQKLRSENSTLQGDLKKLSIRFEETRQKFEQESLENKNLKASLAKKESELSDLEDYFETKKSELKQIQEDLDAQSEKRNRMETLFQDVSEREMGLQQKLQTVTLEKELLKADHDRLYQLEVEMSDQLSELQKEFRLLEQENLKLRQQVIATGQLNILEEELQVEKQKNGNLQEKYRQIELQSSKQSQELEKARDELSSITKANHKLIVESEVLKRELAEIRESLSLDKHVSISAGEKHKRELEGLIKEIEHIKRENKRIKEEIRIKDSKRESAEKEAEVEKKFLENREKELLVQVDLLSRRIEDAEAGEARARGELVEEVRKSRALIHDKDKERLMALEECKLVKIENETLQSELAKMTNEIGLMTQDIFNLKAIQSRLMEAESRYREHINDLEIELENQRRQESIATRVEEGLVVDICAQAPTLSEVTHELSIVKFELTKLQSILQEKEKELTEVKVKHASVAVAANLETSKQVDDLKILLSKSKSQLQSVELQLEIEKRRAVTFEAHVDYLKERVVNLETELEKLNQEKRLIADRLKIDENGHENLRNTIVQELKSQVLREQKKLEESTIRVNELEKEKSRFEINQHRLEKLLEDLQEKLEVSKGEKRKLRSEGGEKSARLSTLECLIEEERRQSKSLTETVNDLESELMDRQSRLRLAEERVAIFKANAERDEAIRLSRMEDRKFEKFNPVVLQLEHQVRTLKNENLLVDQKLREANEKIKLLHSELKKSQRNSKEIASKDKLIEELEAKLAEIRSRESSISKKDFKKLRMTYEILARNELNAKLSEINVFLESRASEQAENERKKERVMEEVQKDLGERLQKSKDELNTIKQQMRETDRSISNLQQQLDNREKELASERSLRKKLERQFEKKAEKKILGQISKPYAYF